MLTTNPQDRPPFCKYILLAPTPVLRRAKVKYESLPIIDEPGLPEGYSVTVLTLDNSVAGKWGNKSLLVSEEKALPIPDPGATEGMGNIVQDIRQWTSSFLKATESAKLHRPWDSIKRLEAYMEASRFATGDPDEWPLPRAYANSGSLAFATPRGVLDRIRKKMEGRLTPEELSEGVYKPRAGRRDVGQKHKPHSPRRDTYWLLTTCKGHTLYIRQGSAVSNTINQGKLPSIPDDWTLRKTAAISTTRVTKTVYERFLAIARDYEKDHGCTGVKRQQIAAIRDYLRNLERETAAQRALARIRGGNNQTHF